MSNYLLNMRFCKLLDYVLTVIEIVVQIKGCRWQLVSLTVPIPRFPFPSLQTSIRV